MQSTQQALVIDNGGGFVKLGLNSEPQPKCIIPTVAGLTSKLDVRTQKKKAYVGYEAWEKSGLLEGIVSPIQKGIIVDFDMMDKIWYHVLTSELKVKTSRYPVLMTEPPNNPLRNREKTTEILFEKYEVPAMYLAIQSVLALYESGRTTGLVVDSGDTITDICPIYEGYALPHGSLSTHIAGHDLTKYLLKLLSDSEERTKNDQQCTYIFSEQSQKDILTVRDMKEKMCYCAVDYESEGSDSRDNWKMGKEHYVLPDGTSVQLGKERIKCPEAMFKPSLVGWEHEGIHYTIVQSVQKCDPDITKELQANIVMSGGNSMFNHMNQRLSKELENLSAPTAKISVHAPPERKHSVWIGGAILSSISQFSKMWMTSQQYKEYGSSSLVHAKCF